MALASMQREYGKAGQSRFGMSEFGKVFGGMAEVWKEDARHCGRKGLNLKQEFKPQRHLLGLLKTSNSTAGLVAVTRAGHFTATSETASMAPRILLLHGPVGELRNNRNSLQQLEISMYATIPSDYRSDDEGSMGQAVTTGDGAREQQRQPHAVPAKVAEELEPTPASAGEDIDAAVQEFDDIRHNPRVARDDAHAIESANATSSDSMFE
ncbi:hypothetical protein EDC04DRAFT_2615283 [Pisolithus marmoratus]|nr:hypothetical protein EDC04DRAFT_2615283 [Pisolithus marmoratus]